MKGPVPSSEEAARRFRAQRQRDTAPEVALRRALHARGLRYRLQQRPVAGLRRTVDLLFPKAKVAVDVRGCFWHRCPRHGTAPKANSTWWDEKLARNVERDLETERLLTEAGWRVVIVWEHDELAGAVEKVCCAIDAGLAAAQARRARAGPAAPRV